jgi:type IV pilus assembly protein PilF
MMKTERGLPFPVCFISLLMVLAGCVSTHSPHLSDSHAEADAAEDNTQLAWAYMQQGNLERAKDKLDRALKEDPTNANVHRVYALFYARINDQKRAEAEFREALRLAPGDPNQLNFYGVYLCGQHRVDEGITKMLQAANNPLYQTPEVAYTNMGVCLRTAHRDDEAQSAFRHAIAVRPDSAEATLQMAGLEVDHGHVLEARERVDRFVGQFTATPELLMLGLRASRTLGDARSAADYAKKLRTEFPNSDEARSLNGGQPANPD